MGHHRVQSHVDHTHHHHRLGAKPQIQGDICIQVFRIHQALQAHQMCRLHHFQIQMHHSPIQAHLSPTQVIQETVIQDTIQMPAVGQLHHQPLSPTHTIHIMDETVIHTVAEIHMAIETKAHPVMMILALL